MTSMLEGRFWRVMVPGVAVTAGVLGVFMADPAGQNFMFSVALLFAVIAVAVRWSDWFPPGRGDADGSGEDSGTVVAISGLDDGLGGGPDDVDLVKRVQAGWPALCRSIPSLHRSPDLDSGAAAARVMAAVPIRSRALSMVRAGAVVASSFVTGSSQFPPLRAVRYGRLGPSLAIDAGAVDADAVRSSSAQIAGAFGVREVRVDRDGAFLFLTFVVRDALRDSVAPDPVADADAHGFFSLGRAEEGAPVRYSFAEHTGHLLVQGETRGGKSVLAYTILSQAAHAPNVRVSGSDPTGAVLEPFLAVNPTANVVLGMSDEAMPEHVQALAEMVAEMDRRIASLRGVGDKIARFSPETPVLLHVVEEFPGLLRRLGTYDAAQKAVDRSYKPLKPLFASHFSRLVAEGAKVGVRMLVLCQRASTEILAGDDRSNFGLRISFRTDEQGLRMLFPKVTPELMEVVPEFTHGRALIQGPWHPLTVWRSAYFGDYQTYREAILASSSIDMTKAATEGVVPFEFPPAFTANEIREMQQ